MCLLGVGIKTGLVLIFSGVAGDALDEGWRMEKQG